MAKKKKSMEMPRVSHDTMDWLEQHTMEDMKELTCEMYSDGVDVSEMVDVVNKLEEIAEKELDMHEDLMMPMPDGTRKKIQA